MARESGTERICRPQYLRSGPSEFLEKPHVLFDIIRPFGEGFGVPFAAWCREEIATVDMDSARKARDWIGDRMNNVWT